MSEAKQDGGPAFPAVTKSDYPREKFGMSLRQWYAGMAMQGLLAHYGHQGDNLAPTAFSVADDMIREGQK